MRGLHQNSPTARQNMNKLFRYAVLIILIAICAGTSYEGRAENSDEKLVIVYTNSLNGYIDFCKCKAAPKGGLVKRSTEIKKIRSEYKNVVLVETGDFFFYESDDILSRALIQSYKVIGYDAIVFGDQGIFRGDCAVLNGMSKCFRMSATICSSKQTARQKLPVRGRVLSKKARTPSVSSEQSPVKHFSFRQVKSHRVLKYATRLLKYKKMPHRSEHRALTLSYCFLIQALALTCSSRKMSPNIDVIVGGHTQTLINDPKKKNGSILVQAGADGAHIGILELSLKNKKISSYKNSFRRPDEFQPEDDPAIRAIITQYKKDVETRSKGVQFN